MGCIWSHEDRDRCIYCNRRAVNNLVFIDNVCEICFSRPSRPSTNVQLKPRFGEYRCSSCGRFWTSRLSWAHTYQVCKRCRGPVYPRNQRDLQRGDHAHSKDSAQEHQKEYCQMCQQLGFYCGNYAKQSGKPAYRNNRRR